jgi:hypothetical protein
MLEQIVPCQISGIVGGLGLEVCVPHERRGPDCGSLRIMCGKQSSGKL